MTSNPNTSTIRSRDKVVCKLCLKSITLSFNLKKHLLKVHSDFLNLRVKEENSSLIEALQITINNHIAKGSFIPQILIDRFNRKKTKVTHFFSRSLPDNISSTPNSNVESQNLEILPVDSPSESSTLPLSNVAEEVFGDVEDINIALPLNDDRFINRKNATFVGDDAISSPSDLILSPNFNKISKNDQNLLSSHNVGADVEQIASSSLDCTQSKKHKKTDSRFGACFACHDISYAYTIYKNDVETALKNARDRFKAAIDTECRCVELADCCCKKTIEKLNNIDIDINAFNRAFDKNKGNEVEKIDCNNDENINFKEYFFRNDSSGRYFCLICYQYSSRQIVKSKSNDWTVKGYNFEEGKRKKLYMQRHLESREHKNCVAQKNLAGKFSKLQMHPPHIGRICTENMCTVSSYFCQNNMSQRSFPRFCYLMDTICRPLYACPEQFVHPVGNRLHSKNALRFGKVACYEAICKNIFLYFNSDSEITKASKKLMVSADKGTKSGDRQRQVLLGTYVNEKGVLKEFVITASMVTKSTGVGAAEHFSKHVPKVTSPKNIVVISTDGDGSYVGSENGMAAMLKKRNILDKSCVFLPDFCHRVERLVLNVVKDLPWVKETLKISESLVLSLSKSKLSKQLLKFSFNSDYHDVFFPPQKISETRWVEYSHIHIDSILRNVDICLKCLPCIIESSDDNDFQIIDLSRDILKHISDPFFIACLNLIDSIYCIFSVAEKQAQNSAFGPFNYLNIIKKLKAALENIKIYNFESIKDILSGEYEYKFKYNKKIYIHKNYLQQVNSVLTRNLRSVSDRSDRFDELKSLYLNFVDLLLENFDDFLKIGPEIELACEIFGPNITSKFIDNIVIKFKKLFGLLNVDFYKCTPDCLGIKLCPCVEGQINRFFSHRLKQSKKNLNFYMSIDNAAEVEKLHIVNILRVIEIVLLLKASQSGQSA